MTNDVNTFAPDHLYKFRSLKDSGDFRKLEQILLDDTVYFANPSSLNDPFECRPAFDYNATKAQARADCNRLANAQQTGVSRAERRATGKRMAKLPFRGAKNLAAQLAMEEAYYTVANGMGMFCASARKDEVLMWSHYADSHLGIGLEFISDGRLLGEAQRVKYATLRPVLPHFIRLPKNETIERALLTKSMQWEYEEEWRAFRVEGPGLVSFPPAELTGIIYGALTPSFVIERIRQILSQRRQPLIEYRAHIARQTFTIDIDKFTRT